MRLKTNYQIGLIGGAYILMAQHNGQTGDTDTLSLNPKTMWLWEQLVGTDFSEEDVVNLLSTRSDTDIETATTDARNWIDSLKQLQIIKP
ncbi:MAG: PqqD family peptide modification chaperone [Bacteroides sp.]